MGLLGEGEPLEPLACPAAGAGLVVAPGAQPEGDVVERTEPGEEQVVLEHDADRAFGGGDEHVGGGVVEDGAVELDAAVVERLEAGDGAQRGGLAGTVGPEQRDDLAVADVEGDVELEVAELHRMARRSTSAGRQPAVAQREDHGQGHGDEHQGQGDGGIAVGLEGEEHGEGHGLGPALEVAGEGDRSAELAQGRAQQSTAPAMIDGARAAP